MPAKTPCLIDLRTISALRRESNIYLQNKPGRVPVADSPSRPNLARLWLAAYEHSCKRPVRTFTYCGAKFCIVYFGNQMCVLDWAYRRILVRPPTSLASLHAVVIAERSVEV